MKQTLFTFSLLTILFLACKNNKVNTPAPPPQDNTYDTSTFFDVKGFFQGEIKDVTTTPYFIYTTITQDERKKDSMHLTTTDFVQLAQEFLEKDITDQSIKHFYKEDVFRDLTTKSVTFSYSTKNKDLDVQNIDILLDEETNKVNFVFIRSNKTVGDSTIITQYNWKRGKNFLINRAILRSDGSRHSSQQFVSWNDD